MALFSGTVVVYAAVHGVHGLAASELEPTRAGFAALVPVLLYNYLGFDVPSAAAGEMRDPQRDLPAGILRAGVWTFVLYAVPVLATLLVIPPDRLTGLTGFVSAIREVFTVYGAAGDVLGTVAGVLLAVGARHQRRHVADGVARAARRWRASTAPARAGSASSPRAGCRRGSR